MELLVYCDCSPGRCVCQDVKRCEARLAGQVSVEYITPASPRFAACTKLKPALQLDGRWLCYGIALNESLVYRLLTQALVQQIIKTAAADAERLNATLR
jgi:hypothetical protein